MTMRPVGVSNSIKTYPIAQPTKDYLPNILIVGCIGSGKDEVADTLVALADYTKLKLGKYVHEHVDFLHYDDNKSKRDEMQQYGQFARATYGAEVWSHAVLKEMQMHLDNGKRNRFVIADCRQFNEIEFWKARGFHVLGIHADEDVRENRVYGRDGFGQKASFKHETEVQAQAILDSDLCDSHIWNNSNCIHTLRREVAGWLDKFIG